MDIAAGIAVGEDGSVYVAGATQSTDFPVTKGSYATTFPMPGSSGYLLGTGPSFVFKLNPDGSLAWSTYFTASDSEVDAIAVDAGGNPYLGGRTYGDLPTTPGAYQGQFQPIDNCRPGGIGPCPPPATSAFLTKFNAQGSALTFSTYISQDLEKKLIQNARGIALAPSGNVYVADDAGYGAGGGGVYLMNASASALLAHNSSLSQRVNINSIALDRNGNLYVTGSNPSTVGAFVTTPGAFQRFPQPQIPSLAGDYGENLDEDRVHLDHSSFEVHSTGCDSARRRGSGCRPECCYRSFRQRDCQWI